MEITVEIGEEYELSFSYYTMPYYDSQPILFAPETLRSNALLGSVIGTEENTQEV